MNKRVLEPRKRRQTTQILASAACHVRQSLHGGALVVRCKVRVLARNRSAFVPYNLTRHEVRNAGCLQHRYRAVAQTVERNLARFTRLVTAFSDAFVPARSRLNKSGGNENFPELIRQRSRALRARCAREVKAFGLSLAGSDAR